MSWKKTIFVPVRDDCMGIVIGKGGRNIKRIKLETRTRIVKKQDARGNLGSETGFTVTGSEDGCKRAELAIRHCVVSIPGPVFNRFLYNNFLSAIFELCR